MLASAALATGVAAAVLYFLGRRESRKQERLDALQRAMRADTENSHE
jgi:hypothetical protein